MEPERNKKPFEEVTMKKYIGTKIIKAEPMNKGQYNAYRGWNQPPNEDPEEEGFLVEYVDGGKPNDDRHEGYISWSPLDAFDKAYRPMVGLTFSLALEAVKKGLKVARSGWNGKGMFIFLVTGSTFTVSRPPLLGIYPEGSVINYRPHIDLKCADGTIGTWAPSNSDALAEDWEIVEEA
jgi:hypothetical protein